MMSIGSGNALALAAHNEELKSWPLTFAGLTRMV
jgi:hypothetical protein